MQRAFWITCHGQQKQKITAKVYHSIKTVILKPKRLKQSKQRLPMTEEHKQKISAARKGKGRPHSKETKIKIGNFRRGKSVPLDIRRKISESERGKFVSQETRNKISESKLRKKF